MTSIDVSGLGRQGFLALAGHPLIVGKDIKPMKQALLSKDTRAAIDIELHARAIAPLAKQAGLAITERGGLIERMEEVYASRIVEFLPGIAASERAYSTILNLIRMDLFESLISACGSNVELKEAKAIANFVNVWTGWGNVPRKGLFRALLSLPLFSARLTASRFQVLFGQPLYQGTARTRKLIAKEYLRTAVGLGVIAGIVATGIKLMWDDDDEDKPTIETDPRSSDFMKVKYGNTRYDLGAGLSQTAVFLSRLVSGETKSLNTGEVRPLSGPDVKFGHSDRGDVALRFLRSKLNPLAGAAWTVSTGKDFKGDRLPLWEIGLNMITPMTIGDTYDAAKDMGIPKGAATGLIAALGISIQTHLKEGESGFRSERAYLNYQKKQAKAGKKAMSKKDKDRLSVMNLAARKIARKKKELKKLETNPSADKAKRQDAIQAEIDAIYQRIMKRQE